MEYEYKCVPVPQSLKVKDGNTDQAIATYETIINEEAVGEWEFVRTDELNSVSPAGCLASLVGAGPTVIPIKMIIFRREKKGW
jgi:hypothetical protein